MFEKIRIAWYSRKLQQIPKNYDFYLSKYNGYYNGLSPELKRLFREKTYISSQFINFIPVHFKVVTEEMRILITSALVQITFGLDKFILRRFKTIQVVPNTYSYKEFKALYGHVDYAKNEIALSWPSVKNGFIIPDDAHNVALHELAHAIHREDFDRMPFGKFFDAVEMDNWDQLSQVELYKIRKRRHHYLNEYAAKNMLEFFAISIETFFEQPTIFKAKLPKLYTTLSELLNQDPENATHPLIPKRTL